MPESTELVGSSNPCSLGGRWRNVAEVVPLDRVRTTATADCRLQSNSWYFNSDHYSVMIIGLRCIHTGSHLPKFRSQPPDRAKSSRRDHASFVLSFAVVANTRVNVTVDVIPKHCIILSFWSLFMEVRLSWSLSSCHSIVGLVSVLSPD